MRILLGLLLLCTSWIGSAQIETNFEKANTLYTNGNYAEAIDLYESILDSGVHSAALYFNLGNANYKLNNIAPSIYYFEKALQLNPKDQDILNNIAFARNMTVDAIAKVPEVGFSRIIKQMVNIANADTWAIIAIAGAVLFVLLFLTYHFSYTSSKKRAAFVISVLALFTAGFATLMAFQQNRLTNRDNPAIVFAQETSVKTEPSLRSEETFRLHEGTKVQVLDSVNDWKRIKLSDGLTGWISSEDIKLLNELP